MDKILNNNAIFLVLYLLTPFLTACTLGIFRFIKNPIFIRRFCKSFFIFEILLLFFIKSCSFNFLGCNFILNNELLILLFVVGFVFLLFSFFSKTFISFNKKIFYLVLVLLFGLLNLFILANNVIFALVCLFCLILVQYLLSSIVFSDNNLKLSAKKQLMFDIGCYFLAVCLISYDFLRYFVIKEIPFEYSTMTNYFSYIDNRAILAVYMGFLLLIFRQFGFLNIFNKYNKLYIKKPFYAVSIMSFVECIMGVSLLLKVYRTFDYLFYQYQNSMVLFLLINLAYFTLTSFDVKNLLKTINSIFIVNVILGIFSIFVFSKIENPIVFYYFIVLILSYLLVLFVFSILEKTFKTKDIGDFKRINDKTKTIQLFVLFSLLNFAKLPVCANFFAFLFCILTAASIRFNSMLLNAMPYIMVVCLFFVGISVFNIIFKILIEPADSDDKRHILFKHQKIVLLLLIFFMFILLLVCQEFIDKLCIGIF